MNINLTNIYESFFSHYGNPKWWPAKTPYEVIVGAVLTQNTNWNNVEKAIANFGDKLSPEFILEINYESLIEIIKPAGFFNQKSKYLKAVTNWYSKYNFSVETVQKNELHKLRSELLAVNGIGKETADSILLYAFGLPTFVVDAYTKRLLLRLPVELDNYNYDTIKKYFEINLLKDTELYNNFHALIVINAKNYCKKILSCQTCKNCPLEFLCEKNKNADYGVSEK